VQAQSKSRSTGLHSAAASRFKVSHAKWPRQCNDRFILARWRKKTLPHRPKPAVTPLRRLSLDLIGLPPTIEEVDAFLKDKSKRAYEKQVESLFAVAALRRALGRNWLDAARYADSDGYER
jgi:hypothetical protein